MGTDIHIQTEVKINGKWEWLGKFLPKGVMMPSYIPTDRSYNFFAILANVRNGTGFAGVKTGDGFNFISNPKGLPDDIDPKLLEAYDDGLLGDHSFSYLTAKELSAFNWDQKTVLCGYVNPQEYRKWKERGEPDSWCGDAEGRTIKKITNKEMEGYLANPDEWCDETEYITHVSWGKKYCNAVPWEMYFAATNLHSIVVGYSNNTIKEEDVRIVFGFDS